MSKYFLVAGSSASLLVVAAIFLISYSKYVYVVTEWLTNLVYMRDLCTNNCEEVQQRRSDGVGRNEGWCRVYVCVCLALSSI